MKVAYTFDLSLDERIAISVDVNGQLVPCTRAEAKAWLDDNPHTLLVQTATRVKQVREDLVEHVVGSLNL